MSEIKKIKERYNKRLVQQDKKYEKRNEAFITYRDAERERIYSKVLNGFSRNISQLKILEIGAGYGTNIEFFKKIGVAPGNIWANDLIDSRVNILKEEHPDINIIDGDARDIEVKTIFDVVFQSMVFSSILDKQFQKELAQKMISLVNDRGIVLWYDFVYDNPWNKDVTGMQKKKIGQLFPDRKMESYRVTLMPQLGRLAGKFYPFLNRTLPFLRTHLIVVMEKKSE